MEGEQKKEGEGEVKEGEVMEGEQKKEGEGEVKEGEEKKEGIITISDYEIDSDGSQDVEVNRIFERWCYETLSSVGESVSLGLGDFIFYSLMVSKASLSSSVPFVFVFIIILSVRLNAMTWCVGTADDDGASEYPWDGASRAAILHDLGCYCVRINLLLGHQHGEHVCFKWSHVLIGVLQSSCLTHISSRNGLFLFNTKVALDFLQRGARYIHTHSLTFVDKLRQEAHDRIVKSIIIKRMVLTWIDSLIVVECELCTEYKCRWRIVPFH